MIIQKVIQAWFHHSSSMDVTLIIVHVNWLTC